VRILLDAKRQYVSDVTAGYLRSYEQGSESFDRIAVPGEDRVEERTLIVSV